MGIKTPF